MIAKTVWLPVFRLAEDWVVVRLAKRRNLFFFALVNSQCTPEAPLLLWGRTCSQIYESTAASPFSAFDFAMQSRRPVLF